MIDLINFEKTCDCTSFTLLIPSVAVGNIGQLTADLIITTYNLQRYARLWHPGILSLASGDPYDLNSNTLSTACELYINEELKLAVLQLRSSIDTKFAHNFFTELKEKVTELKFGNVIIITSTFAYELHTIESSHFRHIGGETTASSIPAMDVDENGKYLVVGSGFAVKLYEILRKSIPCMVLIKYVSEGDNIPDAVATLDVLCEMVHGMSDRDRFQIKYPISWNFVFGNPPPVGIY
ncbi:proteasome assembly chaperone 2 [Onthophagus taurus]|uniref:proteasome assembly chaperone 2 n=1 Tax=Onthophagus taurus TaxID=166361 RepID=UPI000C20E6DB|nr:proteasome assembly chaperone 2-like [Onthophagus taurus]